MCKSEGSGGKKGGGGDIHSKQKVEENVLFLHILKKNNGCKLERMGSYKMEN